jgi:hypothetical protein
VTVIAPSPDLAAISERVREWWELSRTHQIEAWQGYLAVGGLLLEARETFAGDREYGRWFEEQGFGFSTEWARRLMKLAKNKPEVQAVLASALASTTGTPPGVDTLLAMLLPPRVQDDADPRAALVFEPDHHASASVYLIVNYRVGPTPREKGRAHGSGADRREWHAEITMQESAPTSLMEAGAFANEISRQFLVKLRERPFVTMLR